MRELSERELATVVDDYNRDGFAYARSMFTVDELAPLADALDDGAAPGGFTVPDSQGGRQPLSAWIELGDDFVGVLPRLAPVVAIAEAVVGGPVYHWHSKLSWKRPNTNTLWDWHQDYPFWAREGVAAPDMCSIAVAVGPVTRANGCMQLVAGSHHLGPLDIVDLGPTQSADTVAVAEALNTHALEYCELEPGDAVVFHSNTLHSSGPNESDTPRTMLMASYNAVSNPPSAPRNPGYAFAPLRVVPAASVTNGWSAVFGDTPFVDPERDSMDQGYDTQPDS